MIVNFLKGLAASAPTLVKSAQNLYNTKKKTSSTSSTPTQTVKPPTTPTTSAPSSPYNANTNVANEQAYLNSLIAKGGGQAEWAKNQMNILNQFSSSQQPQSSTTPVQSVQPVGGSRDIAGEIISLLTSGGPIDYSKLNNLVSERDAKISTNPDLYGQFENSQSLLNKYLPLAQQNEQLSLQNQQIQDLLTQQQQQPTSVDSIIDLLTDLANEPTPGMSFEEAQNRASGELNPMYSDAANALSYGLDTDMERRGLFNSPLAAGIMTEKQGQLSNDQISAIAQRANQLIENDQEMSLQEKQLRSNTLNSLLSSLIGREANIADFTGYYGGQPTLANQKFQTEKEFGEADLTGNYQGQPTMASKAFDIQARTSQITNALNEVSTLGKVTTQEQADLLGVPVGTSSWQAQNAAAERQQEMQMFEREMSYRNSSLSIQNEANGAQDMLDNFNKDMTIWQATGISPDTEAMRYYGITPGTPWSESQSAVDKLSDAQAEIELIYAEEELLFQNRATDFMNTYGIPRNAAEAAIVIIDQAADYNSAYQIANANKSILQQENVNFATMNDILRRYYNVYEKVVTPEKRNTNVNSGYRGPNSRRIMRDK